MTCQRECLVLLVSEAAAGPNTRGAPSVVASSGRAGAGNPAFVQYSSGANPSDSDAIVVVNNNGGRGTFTLYRDIAAPTGVQINGGATSTN